MEYLPYAFFNLLNPLLAIAFGFLGFRVDRREQTTPIEVEEVVTLTDDASAKEPTP